ncbi:MAG: beta-ketoacyl-[acyl-carrier-protein] synthase family protein [Pirellulales bacterium]
MRDIVITGVGVVSPIGLGKVQFQASLCEGRSGVRLLQQYTGRSLPVTCGGEVSDFDPKQYVKPRKSLKVMSRDVQFAYCAADQACADAGLQPDNHDPERVGVVFGSDMIYCDPAEIVGAFRQCMVNDQFDFSRWGSVAFSEMFPLWLLKYLPNMPACHIGIAHDARGPTNSITLGEVSSLLAISEGMRVIERGQADVMIVGGVGCRLHPTCYTVRGARDLSRHEGDPAEACRPFDAARSGLVMGEGAAAFVLESAQHARRRGAKAVARVLSYANSFQPHHNGLAAPGAAIRNSITAALRAAGVSPGRIGHVNANGLGTVVADAVEAQAIHDVLGDVPVTAPKSYFGNLGAGAGAVELVASLLALESGEVPPTLNYRTPDPECPVRVVNTAPCKSDHPTALLLNQAHTGQAVAMVIAAPE